MRRLLLLSFLCCLSILRLEAQANNKLIAGPMLCYVEHCEAMIWLEVTKDVMEIELRLRDSTGKEQSFFVREGLTNAYNPVKILLPNLVMNMPYTYNIFLNRQAVNLPFSAGFRTKELWEWRKDPPDFSFQYGSCLYLNDSLYDRPGKPYGADPTILEKMAEQQSDFVIWAGDNVYYREADYSSESGMWYRYSTYFRHPALQRLRATRANYAVWDDHDYGPNDSDQSFELKDVALDIFKHYFGSKSYGGRDNPGVYTRYKWSDSEFFLTDNRTYRAPDELADSIGGQPNKEKTFLGKKQLDWLKYGLMSSHSTFKFVVIGSQVLNPMWNGECLRRYPAEYNELMQFINDNKISGVIFLTGDRHFTELICNKNVINYPLYDFTCSSITAGIYNITNKPEFNNPSRIPGSLLMENNFAKISITGKKGQRSVTFETYGVTGEKKWSYSITQDELKFKK